VRSHISSLSVQRPREFGACWLGNRLWQELGLAECFSAVLHDRRGSVEWAKVIELLVVNRLVAPESELGVHQRWYATTAMDVVLGTDDTVAAKDRLYRALDKALEHKEALERHLDQRWRDLFGAKWDLLLYDLTSICARPVLDRDEPSYCPIAAGRPLLSVRHPGWQAVSPDWLDVHYSLRAVRDRKRSGVLHGPGLSYVARCRGDMGGAVGCFVEFAARSRNPKDYLGCSFNWGHNKCRDCSAGRTARIIVVADR
jgi:hypothetical protein